MAVHFIPSLITFDGVAFSSSGIVPSVLKYDPLAGFRNFHNMFYFDGMGQPYEFRANQNFLSDNFMNRNHFMEELKNAQYDVIIQSSGYDALMLFADFTDYSRFAQSPTLCKPVFVDYSPHNVTVWLQEEGFKPNTEYRVIGQGLGSKIICRPYLATLLVTRFGLPSALALDPPF